MNYLKLISLLKLVIVFNYTFSQTSFERLISTASDEIPRQILKTDDGFILLGLKRTDSTQTFNTWLLKLDENCDTLFTKEIFKPIGKSDIFTILKTPDNNYMGFGSIQSDSTYWKYDFWVLKFDSAFNILEDKRYYTRNWYPYKMISFIDYDGSIFVSGYSDTIPMERPDVFIYKVDLNGDTIKSKYFNLGPPRLEMWDALQKKDSSGYYIFCSYQSSSLNDSPIIEIDLELNIKNIKGNPRNIHEKSTARWFSDSTFLIAGTYKPSYILESYNIGIIKLDTAFNKLQERFLGKPDTIENSAYNRCMDFIDINNIYFGGNTTAGPTFSYNKTWLEIFKVNQNLVPIWKKYFGFDARYMMWDLIATNDGGCIMFCSRYNANNTVNERDIYILKVDENGILTSSNPIIKSYNAIVYPNPAIDRLFIETYIEGDILLEIFNINGIKLINSNVTPFNNSIDISNLNSGMYFYRLSKSDNILITGKFIKI